MKPENKNDGAVGNAKRAMNAVGDGALVALIKGYRFYPSCSEYTLEAVQTHGAAKGAYLGAKRILKCQPWHAGGVDLVPEKVTKNS
jgi:putative membrane protein insertion efficiency factor